MPGSFGHNKPAHARLLLALLLAWVVALPAAGQQSGVELDIQRDFLGLGGVVQRGVWAPVRVDLTNTGADNVEVTCRWLLTDEDGDELIAERRNITLIPQRQQGVWLYANPPMSTRPSETWVFQAVATQGGELLAQAQVQLASSAVVESSVNLVGICGFKDLGLQPWTRWSTQHEQLRLVRGLNLETLPDRWYGLDGLSSLVWYPVEGGEPTSNRMSDASKRALREWVYRGGHLVIVLPFAGQQWTSADSGLGDLIAPLTPGAIRQAEAQPPISVFGVLRRPDPVPMLWFDLSSAPGYTSLAEVDLAQGSSPAAAPAPTAQPARDLKPMIVGRRLGFGQVTLVGIDLSETQVLLSLDSFRRHRVWTRIFNWRASKTGELLPPSEFDNRQTASQYVEAKNAQHIELGKWIADRVSRQRSTGPAVGLAFLLFLIYAGAAAMTFPTLLRGRGWERHSWMVFVGIVALFSVVAWGGAWMMRPATTSAAHFTVLDIDGNTNLAHARSWQSVLIPSFTTADVAIPSDGGLSRMDGVNLISSPGHTLAAESPGYPDQRSYAFDASRPDALSVPMRSTTKSFRVDYLGAITAQRDGMTEPWVMPQHTLAMGSSKLPTGSITHRFPGPLHDVHVVFCPGGGQTLGAGGAAGVAPSRPLVYAFKPGPGGWRPGTPLALPTDPAAYLPLWIKPDMRTTARTWRNEGFLGTQVGQRGFSDALTASDGRLVYDTTLLSFFDALPPPRYHAQDPQLGFNTSNMLGNHHTYSRSLVRDLDLTHLITGRRIIVIGHLKDGPSPVPMTVDGNNVDAQGWTVVRWIYDL